LKFTLVGIQPSHLLYCHHTCYLDDEAAVAFFIGVRHCGRTNLAGIETSIPAVARSEEFSAERLIAS
jgi:hypothetical protein